MSAPATASLCAALFPSLADCMIADRHRLRRRLEGLARSEKAGRLDAKLLAQLEAEIAASRERLARRRAALPRPEYPPELPVAEKRAEIMAAIRDHQVVVVAGETGSGKTTQLPKICLELGLGVAGLIGHTQPRRIAARAVATRIAQELKTELGQAVGYKVRFSDRTRPEGYVKLMTDGILLAETQGDRFLEQYQAIIIDEAHERSLNIDFLLGYLKRLLPRRPDLKVIVTSATIDTERFSRHFGNAPVIEVSGRTYPVELRYRPLLAEDEEEQDRDQLQAILAAVDELAAAGPGDVLVFLAGEREIREASEALRKHHPPHTEILPLYARLSAAEQNRVFQPHGNRRIVLATNVAETSLTVPGIRYVVDPGYARLSRYSHRTKVQRLPIEKVSQASANQRAGRCGRVGPGICIRLYDEADFLNRPAFTDPEIRRANLAAVILQMQALGLGEVEEFPFVDPPDRRFISDGYKLLHELGAVDEANRLAPLGRELARLPVDPRLGRMVLAARREGCLKEVLVVAAALTVQDPRERPLDRRQAADEKHRRFRNELSDFTALLDLWDYYHEQARHLSQSKLRHFCKENFLSYVRLREWHDVHAQLHALASDMGMQENEAPAAYPQFHRALLTGLLGNIGFKGEERDYLGARNVKFQIHPGSGLFKKGPKWLMAAELTETGRVYARTVAKIEPEWVEALAGHLVKRSYSDPHWEKKPAQVAAFEKVTLYGLTIHPQRRANYGPVNPAEAREIFIRSALVTGEYHCRAPFFAHNRRLIAEVEELEHKARRRDVLVDEQALYEFFDARLPAGIYSGAQFERWHQEAERENPRLLFLTRDDLMRHDAEGVTQQQFPSAMAEEGMKLKLQYQFEPGQERDGVTTVVPLPALNLLDPARYDWLVPGLIEEKVTALIKSLPKGQRRHFVPAPDVARRCLERIGPADGPLLPALSDCLFKLTGVRVEPEAFRLDQLPAHCRMRFQIVDEGGKPLAEGRDLAELQRRLGAQAEESLRQEEGGSLERDEVTGWDFGPLAEGIEIRRGSLKLRAFPALAEEGERVALRLFDTPEKAAAAHRRGLCRLIERQIAPLLKQIEKGLPGWKATCLHYAPLGRCEELARDLLRAAVERSFLSDELPRAPAAFDACLKAGRGRLVEEAERLATAVGEVLAAHHAVAKRLKGALQPAWLEAAADVKEQLAALVYPGFVGRTPARWLPHLPRYLKAVGLRLDKLPRAPERDRANRLDVSGLWKEYRARAERLAKEGREDEELEEFRWLIEELRVSLFAQELKTVAPVSVPRLKKRWGELGR